MTAWGAVRPSMSLAEQAAAVDRLYAGNGMRVPRFDEAAWRRAMGRLA